MKKTANAKQVAFAIRKAEGGWFWKDAKKLVKDINKAFKSGLISIEEYKEFKDSLIDNLAQPEHDRIRLLNMFSF